MTSSDFSTFWPPPPPCVILRTKNICYNSKKDHAITPSPKSMKSFAIVPLLKKSIKELFSFSCKSKHFNFKLLFSAATRFHPLNQSDKALKSFFKMKILIKSFFFHNRFHNMFPVFYHLTWNGRKWEKGEKKNRN